MAENERVYLKFSSANTKTKKLAKALGLKNSQVAGFSLPAGYTCPGADLCLSMADRYTGKVTDGDRCQFRCFAASTEAMYPQTRAMVWHNFEALKAVGLKDHRAMAALILRDLPDRVKVLRVHVSGDFFNDRYFHAWLLVAQERPEVVFYAYTKNIRPLLPFLLYALPPNFRLTYSYGGKWDELGVGSGLPVAYVVNTPDEAAEKGLPVDHSDALAFAANQDFALLIHGPQPAGSRQARCSRANALRNK